MRAVTARRPSLLSRHKVQAVTKRLMTMRATRPKNAVAAVAVVPVAQRATAQRWAALPIPTRQPGLCASP